MASTVEAAINTQKASRRLCFLAVSLDVPNRIEESSPVSTPAYSLRLPQVPSHPLYSRSHSELSVLTVPIDSIAPIDSIDRCRSPLENSLFLLPEHAAKKLCADETER